MKKTYEKPTFHKTQYISKDSIAFEGIIPLGGDINVRDDMSNCELYGFASYDGGVYTPGCPCR